MNIIKNFRYSIDDIFKQLILSLILIIQLTASLYFLYSGISVITQATRNISKIESIFDTNSLFKINELDELDNLFGIKFKEDSILPRLKNFDDFLMNSDEFTCIKFNNNSIPVEEFQGSKNFTIKKSPTKSINNKKFTRLYALQGDKNFFDNFKFNISDGRYFEDTDFYASSEVPVILGYNYRDVFQLGNKMNFYDEISQSEKSLKVIGFLDKDCLFYQKTLSPKGLYNMNNYMVTPILSLYSMNITKDESIIKNIYFNRLVDSMLISNSNNSSSLENIIKQKSNELNLYNVGIESSNETLNYYKDMYQTQKEFLLIIFFIIFFFTSINIITSLLNFISKRKKEFGIHIMCGATLFDIFERILFQVSLLMSVSFIIMIYISYFINKNTQNFYLDIESLIKSAFIGLFMIILICIIPIFKLKKLNLNSIIKED